MDPEDKLDSKDSTVSQVMSSWQLHYRLPHDLLNRKDRATVQEIGFQICTTPIVQEIFPGTSHNDRIRELDSIRSELFPATHTVTGIKKINPQFHVPIPKSMIDQTLAQILIPTAIDEIFVWIVRYTEFTPQQAMALGAMQIGASISQSLSEKPSQIFAVAPQGYETYRSYLVRIDPNFSIFARNTEIPQQKLRSYNQEFPKNTAQEINSYQIADDFFQRRYIPIFPFDNNPEEWFTDPQDLQIA